MSDLQTDSRMWAAIEGTMRNDPHQRSPLQRTLRAKLIALDARGNEVSVRLITRARSAGYADVLPLRHGDRVRVIGSMSISPNPIAGEPPNIVIDVDSAVRLEGAERTKHSLIQRLTKYLKFWSTK
ncbi:hypothetical protein VSR69_33080 [Paraburkholderia phytofirmans]|uniref:hypothetical protein n=1 Tax=Paraburkholderia sp. BL9I2N2 TaxID=1938809 RepID=UPI00104AAB80|nr:hypothetical protein [Paraburkholderia sp. BL9I2N2]TCK96004.1 hypothetical protein B0G74_2647 [Paraburkholderia sp. BL9I2N2]